MNLIVTENAKVKIDCMGGAGEGTISQGTISISGQFVGSCTINPTYIDNMTIDGYKVVTKLNFEISGNLPGYTPTTKATGSMRGKSVYDKCNNNSFILMDQTINIINGSCTQSSIPYTVATITGTASFIDAGQESSFGE